MVEVENPGFLIPFRTNPVLPDGYPYTYDGISRLTHLSRSDAKALTNRESNRGHEFMVHPAKGEVNHNKINFFCEGDLEVFIKLKLLLAEGLYTRKAIDLLREEDLSIEEILARPQSIRHIIITKPEIFCGFVDLTKNKQL